MLSEKEIAEIEERWDKFMQISAERRVTALLSDRAELQAEIDKLTKRNVNLKKDRDKWKRKYGKLILGGLDNVR